jgi:glycosyltransferase involved in cell wall biosynthesis
MQRKKILWLVSWYPNKNDRFDGDFIQRHARAAAIYHDVHVIFVTDTDMREETGEELNHVTGLTEQIIYFRKKRGFAARLRKQWTWKNLYQDAVKKYIDKNGVPDGVHVHVAWKAGLIALWMKGKFGKGFLLTEHWGFYNKEMDDNFFTKNAFVQKGIQQVFANAKALISVSQFLADEVEMVTGRKCDSILPNVVDTSLFFHKNEKYSRFTFLHVSNMAYWKKVPEILGAFIKLKKETAMDAQLVLIGNRDNHYLKLARDSGLLNESIFFRGELPYKEVAEEMQRAHCHVLFGNLETFSCVTAESLCCGVPVIVPDAGAVPELVTQRNGLVVRKSDVPALYKGMLEMMQTYQSFYPHSIAEEASKKYSYSAVAEKFRQLYDTYC